MAETISEAQDFGSRLVAFPGGAVSITAGAAGDNTEVTGRWVDILGLAADDGTQLGVEGVRFHSGAIVFSWQAAIGAGQSLTLKDIKIETTIPDASGAPDEGSAVEFDSDASVESIQVADDSGGLGTYKVSRYLMLAQQFVRVSWTPDLSRPNTDTAVIGASLVLGGAHVPADQPKA